MVARLVYLNCSVMSPSMFSYVSFVRVNPVLGDRLWNGIGWIAFTACFCFQLVIK